ncbi:unnamed protein product [Diamesa serratosioi]
MGEKLTNEDFRKLLASGAKSSAASSSAKPSSVTKKSSEKHDARRKKKNFYAQLKKQEESVLSELSDKYRDRAKERRDGPEGGVGDARNSTSGYRAVAPDKQGVDAAERRRQLIQESKFLGGDMEHTHLVKGLDYALLQKVRSEIVHKEIEQETEMEKIVDQKLEEDKITEKAQEIEKSEKEQDDSEIKTILGKNIHRLITYQRSKVIERNEMFNTGRMAYLVELEDENAETDIPTTIVRSKAETQSLAETQTLSTNDIVITKLAQIFSYLRQGGRKKNKKRDKDKTLFKIPEDKQPFNGAPASSSIVKSRVNKEEDSIYENLGEYKPPRKETAASNRDYGSSSSRRHSSKSSSSTRDRHKSSRSYFDKPTEEEEVEIQGAINIPAPPKLSTQLMSKLNQAEPEGYNECYPGLQEMNDAIDDSDDEADYTKMDLGNKKGPIGRWDFDTQEEYSDYMGSKEAMPKAAFQYGVKMTDGRKTRKFKTEKKLDQEWTKIQKIITKRKGGKDDEGIDFKKAKT